MSSTIDDRTSPPPVSLPGTLWGLTTYFNPIGYANKLPHLRLFSARARAQGLRLCIVELAGSGTDSREFEVDESLADIVVRVRTDALMWQRERLLNIGLSALPHDCDKVVWVDADLLFENDDWVAETSERLKRFPVVQPFEMASYLPAGSHAPGDGTRTQRGIGATLSSHDNRVRALGNFTEHGHTGFGWAFRRATIERHGYYDGLVVGGADVVMAHAVYDDDAFFEGRNWVARRLPPRVLAHAAAWARDLRHDVAGRVSFTPGTVHHLWHGEIEARRYVERLDILRAADFDPACDIVLNEDRCWTWGSDKPVLHQAIREYFAGRREDG
jgi:hypothetical protein